MDFLLVFNDRSFRAVAVQQPKPSVIVDLTDHDFALVYYPRMGFERLVFRDAETDLGSIAVRVEQPLTDDRSHQTGEIYREDGVDCVYRPRNSSWVPNPPVRRKRSDE